MRAVRAVGGPVASAVIAAIACASTLAGEIARPNPMVHAQGTRIVDGSGEPIGLRGALLDWLAGFFSVPIEGRR